MPQPTLLHLITALHTGGAERMLAGLSHEQAQRYEVHVAYLKPIETLRPLFHPAVQFHYVPLGAGAPSGIQKLVRKIRPAMVHTHLGHADLLGMMALGSSGVPLVCTMHNMGFSHGWKTKFYARLYRILLGTSGRKVRIVAISESVARHVERTLAVRPDRITVLYNPLAPWPDSIPTKAEARQMLGLDPQAPVLLYMGRLEREKGPDVLLNALGRIRDQYPKLQVLMLGEGNMRDALDAQVKVLGLGKMIRFEGYRTDTLPYLAAADVLVAPSRTEALGNTVVEAFRAGLPVVAAETGGLAELVNGGKNGLLFPVGDAKTLAEALEKVLNDETLRAHLAEAGRARVADWPDMAAYARALDGLYRISG